MLALRQQQILAEESGVANTVDPLAGSYFVETLTNRTEQAAWAYIAQIDELGGMVRGHRGRLPAGRDRRRRLRAGTRAGGPRARAGGVTRYADPNEELRIPLLEISHEQERRHLDRLARVRAERDADAHARAMTRLREEARARRRRT